jgi:hypothetical protein
VVTTSVEQGTFSKAWDRYEHGDRHFFNMQELLCDHNMAPPFENKLSAPAKDI